VSSVAETVSGTVVYVTDGDTISVLAENGKLVRVRIAGIDAPLRQQPDELEAKSFLINELSDKGVVLDVSNTDRYGRWLARASQDGRDIGLGAIEAGLAWH
jgi:micrococcal nuclease